MFTKNREYELKKLIEKKELFSIRVLLLEELKYYSETAFINITKDIIDENNRFLISLTTVILYDWFEFENHLEAFFEKVVLIENLMFLSDMGDSNQVINIILSKSDIKIDKFLFFYNMRSSQNYNILEEIFNASKELTSFWYYSVLIRTSFVDENILNNIKKLMAFFKTKELYFFKNINSLYFLSTYSDWDNHLTYRKQITDLVSKSLDQNIEIVVKKTQKKKIAIVSKYFKKGHAIFKCIGAFIEGLREDYDLYLINLNKDNDEKIPDWFEEIYNVYFEEHFFNYGSIKEASIKNGSFDLAIFAEIGLTNESLFLSNLRIANIQITMYGHPVSTQSKFIDYFFVGDLSENKNVSDYYSEKIVRIKGPGMNSVKPTVERVVKNIKKNDETINVFFMSSPFKLNPIIIKIWKNILKSNPNIKFHIFIGMGIMQDGSILKYQLSSIFKDSINVYFHKSYEEYMGIIKSCDIAFGSYRYGDFNTVVDALWMGVPTILVDGDCGYQKHGIGALKSINLEELIAKDLIEYEKLANELIKNESHRDKIREKIFNIKLEETLIRNQNYIDDFKIKIESVL